MSVDIVEFFRIHAKKDENYCQFYTSGGLFEYLEALPQDYIDSLKVENVQDAFERVLRLLDEDTFNDRIYYEYDAFEYILLAFYLYKQKAYIQEFPDVFRNPCTLFEFYFDRIDQYMIEHQITEEKSDFIQKLSLCRR